MLTVTNIHCKNEIWNLYQFWYNLVTTLGIPKSGTYEAYTNFMEYELHTYTFCMNITYTIIIFQILYKFEMQIILLLVTLKIPCF